MKLALVVGARPNFIKADPILRALAAYDAAHGKLFKTLIIHTGQHYDYAMSQVFFKDLALPEPDIHLDVGSGSHAEQTGRVMIAFEQALVKERPEMVVVVGDVNSTLAAAITAVKLRIPVAHVEAGVRSFDKTMPEEINRVLTDQISDLLFTPSPDADENLRREGIPTGRIHFVGSVMVDALLAHLDQARARPILSTLGFPPLSYALLTLHRPANVDDRKRFTRLAASLRNIASKISIIFPTHPRTRKKITEFGLDDMFSAGIRLIDPVGYLDFVNLTMNARMVLTDSGGIQEETTVLRVPCFTLRDSTEWQETVKCGSNVLVPEIGKKMERTVLRELEHSAGDFRLPELWDGKTAERIVEVLATGK